MNYFLEITSRPNYPLYFDFSNNVDVPSSFCADLRSGVYIQYPSSPLIYCDSENSSVSFDRLLSYDVLNTVGGGILVSNKVKEVIEDNFLGEVQFFDAIFSFKGKKCNAYTTMNICNQIECYDMDKSIYTIDPIDGSYHFDKRVLIDSPLEEYGINYNIVRCSLDNEIVVSDKFKKVIMDNKIKCMSFIKNELNY